MQRRTLIAALAGSSLGLPSWPAGPAPTAAATISVAASGGDLLFGQSATLSGPLGVPVQQFNTGIQLAFEELNRQGGLNGRNLRLISLDDELLPDRARANCQNLLKDHKVFAFLGCVGSATTAAVEPLLRESGVPAFGGYAVADSVRLRCRGAAYFLRATYGREAAALVRHLTTIGVTRIGLAVLDNPGGAEVVKLITAEMARYRLEPAVTSAVSQVGANLADTALQITSLQPQAVLMFLGSSLTSDLMALVNQRQPHTSFYGLSISGGDLSVTTRPSQRLRGLTLAQVMPSPWHQTDPVITAYRRLALDAQVPPGYLSLEGYLTARVLIEALRRSGPEPQRARLHATLRSLRTSIASLDIDFTQDGHTGSRFVDLVQITADGRFIR